MQSFRSNTKLVVKQTYLLLFFLITFLLIISNISFASCLTNGAQGDLLPLYNGAEVNIFLSADNYVQPVCFEKKRVVIGSNSITNFNVLSVKPDPNYFIPQSHEYNDNGWNSVGIPSYFFNADRGFHINGFGHVSIGKPQDDSNYILSMFHSYAGDLKASITNEDMNGNAYFRASVTGGPEAFFGVNKNQWDRRAVIETSTDNSTNKGIAFLARTPDSEISFINGTGGIGSDDETMTVKKSSVAVNGAFSVSKDVDISNSDPSQMVNVNGISAVRLVSGAGGFTIKGFSGGVPGQILYVFYGGPNNYITIRHNSINGAGNIYLGTKNDVTFGGTAGGGMILRNFSGSWYEIGRAY